jgi:hypothetical protein
MGFFDWLFRRKKSAALDEPVLPAGPARDFAPEYGLNQAQAGALPQRIPFEPQAAATAGLKAEMDLILSQLENVRMQYEAISARLQNIERLVSEIRRFWK